MALKDQLASVAAPPGFRRGNAKARCGLCSHFDGRGECMKFGVPVRPTMLSDAFKPIKESGSVG